MVGKYDIRANKYCTSLLKWGGILRNKKIHADLNFSAINLKFLQIVKNYKVDNLSKFQINSITIKA